MSSVSLVYAHPLLYRSTMRLLYGKHFEARYDAVAALIAPGEEVFEVCAGDGYLYERNLRALGVRYRGCDLGEAFVRHARQRGVAIERLDVTRDALPIVDCVVIQASLYQFIPDEVALLDKLLRAARRALIVAEPVRNLSSSTSPALRWLAQRSADPGNGHKAARFNEQTLDALFHQHYPARILSSAMIPGGREKVYCLAGMARAQ